MTSCCLLDIRRFEALRFSDYGGPEGGFFFFFCSRLIIIIISSSFVWSIEMHFGLVEMIEGQVSTRQVSFYGIFVN